MAILFGRISNVSRGGGGSAIKAAAYRSCSILSLNATDTQTNITVPISWDYSKKSGLVYSQIHAPENAPEWVFDRQTLWQRVEDVETKQNARLAGEYTLALPKELSVEQNTALLKEFAEEVFVSRGIIVDVNFHNDNPNNPHAHCMYALRELEEKMDGEIDFSRHRCRDLQSRAFLEGVIKESHKQIQNIHLEKNGFEQKLEWGVVKGQEATIHHGGIKEAFARNQEIVLRNAANIIADPTIIIDKLDFNKSVFTKEHIEQELEKALLLTIKDLRVGNQTSLDIYTKNELVGLLDTVLLSPKLTMVNACDLKGRMLFAKTEQVNLEKRFIENISNLADQSEHRLLIKEENIDPYKEGREFSNQQKKAIIDICGGSDLAVLEGWPGAGKSTVTKEIARQYQKKGYEIIGAAPTNKAAQELEAKLGIKVYTTSALRMKWQYDRGAKKVSVGLGHEYYKDPLYDLKEGILDKKTLLILDEASMIDVANSDYFVSEAKKSGAKLLALGDNNQNQAIGSKGAFARMGEVGSKSVLTEVNRHQNSDLDIRQLHIEATSALCNYNISKAVSIYDQLGKINILENEQEKEAEIARSYIAKIMNLADKQSINTIEAAKQVVISSYTNAEIKNLNISIRNSLKSSGALSSGKEFISGGVYGKSNMVEIAQGDRIIFTRNLREEDGVGGVLNNELATVRKLLKVDAMGCGEFLADVEGANGIRQVLIRTGEEGRIITFKHGYAVTNHAVQGASVPHKLYSIDQYSGYQSFLVGLTRHKIDCEIFAAKDTLENEVYKTRDLDIDNVREEYKAIGYEYEESKDASGNKIEVKSNIPLWKLGLHLLASKRSDLSFAVDASYGSVSVEIQKELQSYREQLEGLREDLRTHEKELADFESLANILIIDEDKKENNRNSEQKEKTVFELHVEQHFKLKENIIFDIVDVMSSPSRFRAGNSNISVAEQSGSIENYLASLKSGINSNGEVDRLSWSDLSKNDKDLVLWSYIDKEDRVQLEKHYSSTLNLTQEIQDKAESASTIWKELEESGFKSQDTLTGNYKVVKEYLAARAMVKESYEKDEIFNKQLNSAKIQKLLVEAINEQYGIKLKFIIASMSGMNKADSEFLDQKTKIDAKKLKSDIEYKSKSIEEDRQIYLQSLKDKSFKEILSNSNLLVKDIMESAKDNTELSKLSKVMKESTIIAEAAKSERIKTSQEILNNWSGHIDKKSAVSQPSFAKILGQLNINYHTLSKHAGEIQEKHYFEKLVKSSLGKNTDYLFIMQLISKVSNSELVQDDISMLLKSHDGLCEHVELVSEYIEELKDRRLLVQNSFNKSKARLKEIQTYQNIELPNFIKTIYQEDSKEIISKLDDLLLKANDKIQLGNVTANNPEILGELKAQGLISKIFSSEENKIVDTNLKNLGNRIDSYIKGKEEVQMLKQEMANVSYADKLTEIDKELGSLRSFLPNASEINILEDIGKLQNSVLKEGSSQKNIDKFSKKINKLLLKDNAQDALFAYQRKHNIFLSKEDNKNNKDTDLNQHLKQKAKFANKAKDRAHTPSLTFDEVKAGLSPSIISEIFHHYGSAINPDSKIEKKSNHLKIGSLHMSLSDSKKGLWHRFSDGSKGDIFGFVSEATGCSKREALDIVASYAGIIADDNRFKDKIKATQVGSKATIQKKDTINQNIWKPYKLVPESAATFRPRVDLAFAQKKGAMITHTHEYRNIDNQLLGYTVRIEELETGKKQVLPVAYCNNEAKSESRWQLKGFSDAGSKPIYGLEKLKQNPNSPILIVEGEKTADVASKLLPDYNVISWMGGAQGVDRVDWSKLSNKLVSIWPDNDKAGREAADNIVNHIDCSNGFSGLVSVVDTQELGLPEKWDLADNVPEDSKISNTKLNDVIEHTRRESPNISNRLEAGQEICNSQDKDKHNILDSIEMLVVTNRISEDEYVSKEIYHDSLVSIASSKNINLSQVKEHKDFVNAICSLQDEYQSLHRNYKQNIESNASDKNKLGLSGREQLASNLIRDISILHQIQLGQNKLTATHSDHIEKAVSHEIHEIDKIQRFEKSDQEHIASNIYKTINTIEWRDQLDYKNSHKTSNISLRFTAKTIDDVFFAMKKELLDKCDLINNKRDVSSVEQLKTIANIAVDSGAKTKEDIISDLQQSTNIKAIYTKLDKDIEIHHISSNLQSIAIEKQASSNSKEAIKAIEREQAFLSGLHNNIKYIEHYDKQFIDSINNAHKIHQVSSIDNLNKVVQIIESLKFTKEDSIINTIKNSSSSVEAHDTLTKNYQEHFIKQVNKGLNIIDKKGFITLDKQEFVCPKQFMDHVIKSHTHEYVPHKQLQQLHHQVVEQHKSLDMSKGMEM